jgi:hypothetical protein
MENVFLPLMKVFCPQISTFQHAAKTGFIQAWMADF